MSVTEPIFIASAATDAAIRAAATAANAHGGGIVKIPAGTITLSSPLPVYSGVIYQGTAYQSTFVDGSRIGGTILQGDGTFNAFEYNPTDGVTRPTVFATFVAGMLNGFGLVDLTLYNFLYGVKIGALYQPGMQFCRFENVYATTCQQWGFWFENYINCKFINLTSNANVAGGIARVCSGGSALFCGNSSWIGSFVQTAQSPYSRGIVTWARVTTEMNDNFGYGEQVNTRVSTTLISQAATMSNASANITVTDSTAFPVGLPVTVSATANGFVAREIYFVLSSAANVITIGRFTYGPAIAATGNTAVNIQSHGYCAIEFAGLDSGSSISASVSKAMDLEASCAALMLLQNVNFCELSGYFGYDSSKQTNGVVVRTGAYSVVDSPFACAYDIDISSNTMRIIGTRTGAFPFEFGSSGGTGIGASFVTSNDTGRNVANSLAIYFNGQYSPEMYLNSSTHGIEIRRAFHINPSTVTNGGSIDPGSQESCYYVITYTSASGSATLPTITSAMTGLHIWVSNPQANAFTLNTSSSQTFNGSAGVTTLSVAAHTAVHLGACDNGSGTLYWARFN
jgi:hypothetical protein